MTIDMQEVRDEVIGHLHSGVQMIRDLPPHDYLMMVATVLLGAGGILAANLFYQNWRKKRGYRMVLQERRDKIDRLLSDGINSVLFEAELAGKISSKELDAEYQRIADKLGLPDLIPKERRLKIVKNEIKSRLNKGPKGKKPANPITGKKKPFRERIGTFANQFWRTKGA